MNNEVMPLSVFGGGGCAGCTGISLDIIRGGLIVEASVPLPSSAGVPIEVSYNYNSNVNRDGPFGKGRAGCGTPGMKLTSLDNYGQIYITQGDGSYRTFTRRTSSAPLSYFEPQAPNSESLEWNVIDAPTKWVHQMPDNSYYIYNGSGAAPGEKPAVPYYAYDGRGNSAYFAYDGYGRMTQVLDTFNRATYFTYDGVSRRIASVQDCRDATTYFAYTDGCLTAVTGPEQCTTYYEHDTYGRLIRLTDPEGYFAYFRYDQYGGVRVQSVECDGATQYFSYDDGYTGTDWKSLTDSFRRH